MHVALRDWLLDRLESSRYWPEPAALTTVARLAAEARADADFVQVARLYAGRDDVDIAGLVAELVKAEAVPYLAAFRYTRFWDAQVGPVARNVGAAAPGGRRRGRRDDPGAAEVRASPTSKVWRGSTAASSTCPKERFISYPGAERETDPSLVIGWAGWDHLARARALATWYLQADVTAVTSST